MTDHAGRLDGQDVRFRITPQGIEFPSQDVPWYLVDTLIDDDLRIVLGVAQPGQDALATRELSHLGPARDRIAQEIREVRGAARRAWLAQAALAPLGEFTAHHDGGVTDVVVLPQGLQAETRGSLSHFMPWGLVEQVRRDGYRVDFLPRRGDPLEVAGLGGRTDEFMGLVAQAQSDLEAAVRLVGVEMGAADVMWEDGWAISAPAIAGSWSTTGGVAVLAEACEDLRAGIYTEGGTRSVPFLLGRSDSGRVVVEGVGEEDRATFVFDSDDIERVNAALLRSSFRRELLFRSESDLGGAASAVRLDPEIRWLRSVLAARVIHDDAWERTVRDAMTPSRA